VNIGLDSFAFIDDSPFELAEVSAALPMVSCVNANDLHSLWGHSSFSGSTSPDAKQRRHYYQDAMRRAAGTGRVWRRLSQLLASCEIRLDVQVYEPSDFERL